MFPVSIRTAGGPVSTPRPVNSRSCTTRRVLNAALLALLFLASYVIYNTTPGDYQTGRREISPHPICSRPAESSIFLTTARSDSQEFSEIDELGSWNHREYTECHPDLLGYDPPLERIQKLPSPYPLLQDRLLTLVQKIERSLTQCPRHLWIADISPDFIFVKLKEGFFNGLCDRLSESTRYSDSTLFVVGKKDNPIAIVVRNDRRSRDLLSNLAQSSPPRLESEEISQIHPTQWGIVVVNGSNANFPFFNPNSMAPLPLLGVHCPPTMKSKERLVCIAYNMPNAGCSSPS